MLAKLRSSEDFLFCFSSHSSLLAPHYFFFSDSSIVFAIRRAAVSLAQPIFNMTRKHLSSVLRGKVSALFPYAHFRILTREHVSIEY
jgi:hypothetical protein